MNPAAIAAKVAELVPDAKDIRTRESGGHVYALICTMDGRMRSVQFDSSGLYGATVTGMFQDWPKSNLYIAAEIAKELRK